MEIVHVVPETSSEDRAHILGGTPGECWCGAAAQTWDARQAIVHREQLPGQHLPVDSA